jgi:hypothetical protein
MKPLPAVHRAFVAELLQYEGITDATPKLTVLSPPQWTFLEWRGVPFIFVWRKTYRGGVRLDIPVGHEHIALASLATKPVAQDSVAVLLKTEADVAAAVKHIRDACNLVLK